MKLNKKNALMSDWDDKCDRAFYKVQTLLNNADILKHPEMGKPFYIWTDASVKGMGAVLMQKDTDGEYKPIEFYSKAFSGSEINWHITTKELFVVVKAIEKWNHYLGNTKFSLFTDAKNIEWLFKSTNEKKTNNRKHYRWAVILKSK
ncbi:MAG: hypothetical protein GY941_12085 [Planctomycetes bacterium]|nr:hypothetical protein [Planctomycetota bacterium]